MNRRVDTFPTGWRSIAISYIGLNSWKKTVFLILKSFQTRLFQPQLKKVKLLHKNLLKTPRIRSLTFFILLTVQLSQVTINRLDQITNFYRSLTFSIFLRSGFATNGPIIAKVIAHFIGSLTNSAAEHADSTAVPHAPLQTNLYSPRFSVSIIFALFVQLNFLSFLTFLPPHL